MTKDYNYADCSNCRKPILMSQASQALILRQGEKTVAAICPECQRAKKIQLTLKRISGEAWEYYQLFPVET
jgi:RNase P subunit RPR2